MPPRAPVPKKTDTPPVPAPLVSRVSQGSKANAPSLEEIKHLLETNIKWNEVVYDSVQKLNRRVRWMHIAGWVKILIVVLPLVLGIMYVVPYIEPLIDMYQELFFQISPLLKQGSTTAGTIQEIPSLGSVSSESIQEILKGF